MRIPKPAMWLATCLVSVACAGVSPAGQDLGASVPWEEPVATARGPEVRQASTSPSISAQTTGTASATPAPEAEPPPEPEPALEVIGHGVQPVQRTDREVILLSVFEVINRSDAAVPVPPIDVVAEVVTARGHAECSESVASADPEGERDLQPGERRMMWVRSTCPSADEPQVVRATAHLEGAVTPSTELGEAIIVESGIDRSATATLR